jgi:GDP-L-fucose synthase
MDKNAKIYIAGHNGMVGSAILRNLKLKGYTNFVFTSYPEYDLTNQKTVHDFFLKEKPEYVIDAAAKVGGINANNTFRAQFLYENMMIQNNLIHNAYNFNVKKLLFLGSSCIYPKKSPQPIREEYLLTGLLESTNEPYAIAKISGIKMCESYFKQYGANFISVMPTNLYGPGDTYDIRNSHVIPALIMKIHDAKIKSKTSINVWGTGNPRREFLYVDDLADACIFLFQNIDAIDLYPQGLTHLNIGSGEEVSIKDLVEIIAGVIGYSGRIKFDTSMPDGTMRKLLDSNRLRKLGWSTTTTLSSGISSAYKDYLKM